MNYAPIILLELDRLERFSDKYKSELMLLSKNIRKKIWTDSGSPFLALLLRTINETFDFYFQDKSKIDLDVICEIICILAKYGLLTNPTLDTEYYHKLLCDIHMENARVIIGKKWDNILAAEEGSKSFIDTFGDVYDNCINQQKGNFFHELKNTDVLCRAVSGWGHDKARFIPWPNKTQNRWNPPGKTYLYLSFAEHNEQYDKSLSINEYICLKELRAEEGKRNKYSTCLFQPINKGNILDLSYNDIELYEIDKQLDDYSDDIQNQIWNKLMSAPDKFELYKTNPRKLKNFIHNESKTRVDKNVIAHTTAQRYLKMVCEVIYKKVDSTDEAEKEKQYRSFHILSSFLETKGVTGIIYPCTRTRKIIGKNLVLFNPNDAVPIDNSIREIEF